MAVNVFGNPITDDTLKAMAKYVGKVITRHDRAYEALNMKTAENKAVNARNYVDNLKKQYGSGTSTKCLIYNATGDPVNFIRSHDWSGVIGPGPYPRQLANGQWGGFLHVKKKTGVNSKGALVYRGLSDDGNNYDWMQCWSTPFVGNNRAYTEVRGVDHFDDTVWGTIEDKMSDTGKDHRDLWNGCLSIVTISSGTTSVFEGILTQEGLALY